MEICRGNTFQRRPPEKSQRAIEESFPPGSPTLPSAPPCSPAAQANPEQTLLHVWLVLVSCGLNALLHSLRQLPQLLDLPQVLIGLLALFLGLGWGGERKGARDMASRWRILPHLPPAPQLQFKWDNLEGLRRQSPNPLSALIYLKRSDIPPTPYQPTITSENPQDPLIVALTCAWAGDSRGSLPLSITTRRTPFHFSPPELAHPSPVWYLA